MGFTRVARPETILSSSPQSTHRRGRERADVAVWCRLWTLPAVNEASVGSVVDKIVEVNEGRAVNAGKFAVGLS